MQKICILLTTIILISLTSFCYASEPKIISASSDIKVYEDPNTQAKIVATIKKEQTYVQLFAQDNWLKVTIPATGHIGWIKSSGANPNPLSTIVSPAKNTPAANTPVTNAPADASGLSDKQAQELFNQLQAQQQALQASMDKTATEAARNFAPAMGASAEDLNPTPVAAQPNGTKKAWWEDLQQKLKTKGK